MRFFIILLLSFGGVNSYAQECSDANAKTENVAEYLSKMAESLTHIKLQFKKIGSLRAKKNADATDALVALKELKAGYLCSSNMIGSYKNSKIENIAKSADSLSKSYQMLSVGVESSINELKSEIDGKRLASPGERADHDADKMLDVKKKWELAIMAIGLGTYSAVGKVNTKTKKNDTLVISRSERNEIIKILRSEFSLPTKKGDSDPIDTAANIYFGFLNQSWNFK